MTKATPALVLALASALLLSAALPAAVYVAIDFVSLWGRPPSDHWELYRLAKGGPAVLIVAFAHAVVLGLPLALIMRHQRPMTALRCLMCGFLIGAVPWFTLGQLSNFMGSASVGGRDLSVNGVPTLYGIWSATWMAIGMGCLGALGGLAFWGILRLSGIQSTGDFSRSLPQIWLRTSMSALVVLALAVPIWRLPDYFEIRSCHNLFRSGHDPISPVAILNVDVQKRDWPRLRSVFAQVNERHGMSFWDDSWDSKGTYLLGLSLCNEAGTNIEANGPFSERGVYISLYKVAADPTFIVIASDFVQSLAASWPGKISVKNSKGELVSPVEFFRQEKKQDAEFLRTLAN